MTQREPAAQPRPATEPASRLPVLTRSRGRASACSGFPAEEADREEEPGKAPGGYHQDVGPVERGAEEPGLHSAEEMPDREEPAGPEHPGGRVVPERDEDPGQEEQRQDDGVDDRPGGVCGGDGRG